MSQPAWEPLGATLEIEGEAEPLLRFETNRNMLATNSNSTPPGGVTAELVDAGRGTVAELDQLDVRGKIVFAVAGAGRVFGEAVLRRGGIGVIGYSLPAYLQPEKHRRSIQFGGVTRDTTGTGWGILLSYEAHERLRAAITRAATAGTSLRLHVSTSVKWTPNAVEGIARVHG